MGRAKKDVEWYPLEVWVGGVMRTSKSGRTNYMGGKRIRDWDTQTGTITYHELCQKIRYHGFGEVQRVGYFKPKIKWMSLQIASTDEEVKLMFQRGKEHNWLKVYIETDVHVTENMDYDHSNYISEDDCPDADMEESVVQERPKEYTLNLYGCENEAEEEMGGKNPVFQQKLDEVPAETHLHHDHANFCDTNAIDSTILDGTLEIDIGVDGYFSPFLNEDSKDSDGTSLGEHELYNEELMIARENKIKMINTTVDHGSGLGLDVPIANSHPTQHGADQFKEENDEMTAGTGPMIVSEYEATNEEFSSTCSSEEGVLESKKRKSKVNNVYDPSCDYKKLQFNVGMIFCSKQQLMFAVRKYELYNGFNVEWKRSEATKVDCRCRENCRWRLYACTRGSDNSWVIRTYQEDHVCFRIVPNRQANSDFLVTESLSQLREDPDYGVDKMIKEMNEKDDITVEKHVYYRARNKAMTGLNGSLESQHAKMSRHGVGMQCQLCLDYGHNKRGCPRKYNLPAPRNQKAVGYAEIYSSVI